MESITNIGEIQRVLEAVLFAAGHPLTYEKLSKLFYISVEEMKRLVIAYADMYNDEALPRGVMLLTFEDSCQLCTKERFAPYIRDALDIKKGGNLSNSSLETLSVVAYNQPVTRAYIDTVRGVDSSYSLTVLTDRGLVEPQGRLDAPGRPVLYGTTDTFLRCFGLTSLSELPHIKEGDLNIFNSSAAVHPQTAVQADRQQPHIPSEDDYAE